MIFRVVMALGVDIARPQHFFLNKRIKTKRRNALSTCPRSHSSLVAASVELRSPDFCSGSLAFPLSAFSTYYLKINRA